MSPQPQPGPSDLLLQASSHTPPALILLAFFQNPWLPHEIVGSMKAGLGQPCAFLNPQVPAEGQAHRKPLINKCGVKGCVEKGAGGLEEKQEGWADPVRGGKERLL